MWSLQYGPWTQESPFESCRIQAWNSLAPTTSLRLVNEDYFSIPFIPPFEAVLAGFDHFLLSLWLEWFPCYEGLMSGVGQLMYLAGPLFLVIRSVLYIGSEQMWFIFVSLLEVVCVSFARGSAYPSRSAVADKILQCFPRRTLEEFWMMFITASPAEVESCKAIGITPAGFYNLQKTTRRASLIEWREIATTIY